jgi:two-component system response regulator
MQYDKLDILLIEDNIHDVTFIMEAVKASGMDLKLHRLPDGAEALNFLYGKESFLNRDTGDQPKMILTDLRMPKMDGYDLLKLIKKDDKTKEIPVVVMTTSSSDDDIERSYRLGANSYLVKPMDIDVFIDKLIKVFNYWLKVNVINSHGYHEGVSPSYTF